jgi:hypothetical protein
MILTRRWQIRTVRSVGGWNDIKVCIRRFASDRPNCSTKAEQFVSCNSLSSGYFMLRAALVAVLVLTSARGPLICCCAIAAGEASLGSSQSSGSPQSNAASTTAARHHEKPKQRICRHDSANGHRHSHSCHKHRAPILDPARSPETQDSPEPCDVPCECAELTYLSAVANGRRSLTVEKELVIRPVILDPVGDFFSPPEAKVVYVPGRFENASFPFLTAKGILRALQTFRC